MADDADKMLMNLETNAELEFAQSSIAAAKISVLIYTNSCFAIFTRTCATTLRSGLRWQIRLSCVCRL